MKIQINGFDIEIDTETDDTNMVIKVLDASGKELSNNTYAQSTDVNDNPDAVEMPSAEETAASDNPDNPEEIGDDSPDQDDDMNDNPDAVQGEEEEVTEEEMQEGLIPSFEQWKKINEAKKVVKEDIDTKIKNLFKIAKVKPGIGIESFWNAVEDLEKNKDPEKKKIGKKLRSLGNKWEKMK